MKNEILTHLNDPSELEKLYRNNRAPFTQEFRTLYPELKGNLLADFWNERLRYESDDISWGAICRKRWRAPISERKSLPPGSRNGVPVKLLKPA